MHHFTLVCVWLLGCITTELFSEAFVFPAFSSVNPPRQLRERRVVITRVFSFHNLIARNRNRNRFDAIASNETSIEDECILTIDNQQYNVTAWANAHPGGVNVLKKFHGQKDATRAFYAAGHSDHAIEMLQQFRIINNEINGKETNPDNVMDNTHQLSATATATARATSSSSSQATLRRTMNRWRTKLVSREDPRWIHKVLGLYALLHFIYRVGALLFGTDPAAGFGSQNGSSWSSMMCLIPHLLLSYSSLIFHTVPKERVVGKPMIWKENRWHSILFGTRSVVCSFFAWLSIRYQHIQPWRTLSVVGTCITILLTMMGADVVTRQLQPSTTESSVATLPFWDNCQLKTQQRIKYFYAYTQFIATSTCLLVANPAWPFSLLFPIQFASFLLTLCRKGLISAKTWHIGYAGSLILPFFLAMRLMIYLKSISFVAGLMITSMLLFQLRCFGINKYVLWIPMLIWRVFMGDQFIPFTVW